MPIRTQLVKKWLGPDPEKHIGSTPLKTTRPEYDRRSETIDVDHTFPVRTMIYTVYTMHSAERFLWHVDGIITDRLCHR